jgi:hypothetical protein
MNQAQFCINFILAVLATWRVTHLLANEDGPADLIVKLRAALGESFAGTLMDCFNCVSMWIAAPAALFVVRTPLKWVMVWLALSGSACLLQRLQPKSEIALPVTHPSEGDFSHVLWSEANRPAEQPDLGEVTHSSRAPN